MALVCGASQGIGRATALLMAQAGAKVIALARSEDKLEVLAQELGKFGENHSYIAVDMSEHQALSTHIEQKLKHYSKIDIVVNNTGGPPAGPMLAAEPQQLLSAINSHVGTAMVLQKLTFASMQETGYGRIINVLSTSVRVPIPNLGISNMTRVAMASWAKTLVGEIGSYGITVNNILPGYTSTPRLESLIKSTADKQNKDSKEVISTWENSIPLRRFGTPQEIAQVITFIASPLASYINGVSLAVDGGRTLAL